MSAVNTAQHLNISEGRSGLPKVAEQAEDNVTAREACPFMPTVAGAQVGAIVLALKKLMLREGAGGQLESNSHTGAHVAPAWQPPARA